MRIIDRILVIEFGFHPMPAHTCVDFYAVLNFPFGLHNTHPSCLFLYLSFCLFVFSSFCQFAVCKTACRDPHSQRGCAGRKGENECLLQGVAQMRVVSVGI